MNRSTNLEHSSLSKLKSAFREGAPIGTHELRGFYPGVPAGPWWFRLGSGPTLGLTGFGGWIGKRFSGDGRAVNMFRNSGIIEQRFPMTLTRTASRLDGQDTLLLNYPTDARAPWCWVTDELRWVDGNSILGMTFVNAPGLRHMVFPFVIRPERG